MDKGFSYFKGRIINVGKKDVQMKRQIGESIVIIMSQNRKRETEQ